jgi:hypothetical protein
MLIIIIRGALNRVVISPLMLKVTLNSPPKRLHTHTLTHTHTHTHTHTLKHTNTHIEAGQGQGHVIRREEEEETKKGEAGFHPIIAQLWTVVR